MRWKMHKLGFLNFWLYDREEFVIDDGHILLRGDNASGKSITTQSFIPFILDGNRRPERLDPFGSRDRKMEFYLLGDGEREDSTGYLYLEFRKPDVEEYRTIGVGMRAQRDKGITRFWGFCLADGRRIGPGGLSLCEEKEKGTILPLSHRRLKEKISGNCWADTPEEYKALVNREIFGFADIREYDQLVQLLIKVRAPKLSKDMRPSEVKTILRDSLQVLTEADLSAMSAVMDRMDQMEETLQGYETAMRDIQIIRNEYTRYNQYMLGLKGRAYLDARKDTQECKKDLTAIQREQEETAEEQKQQTERRDEAGRQLDEASARRAEMGEDSLSAKRDALNEHLRRCKEYKERDEGFRDALTRLKDKISEQEAECQRRRQQTERAGQTLLNAVRELESVNRILLLGEEHREYVSALKQTEAGFGQTADLRQTEGQTAVFRQTAEGNSGRERASLALALEQRRKQIRDVLKTFQELAPAQSAFEDAQKKREETEQTSRAIQETLRDAQEEEHQERARVTEGFARWKQENRQMVFPPETWKELRLALEKYQGPACWGPIQRLAEDCFRGRANELHRELQNTEIKRSQLEDALREEQRKLEQVQTWGDPMPPRREAVQAARTRLSMQGIPFAAFYEAVDFAPDLPPEERNLIEAQLTDAGLIDALLVQDAHAAALKEILAEYPDCFLLPGPPVKQPVTGLTAVEGPFRAMAEECLRCISGTEMEAETALLPDGRYRNGILRGRSHAEEEARYVGPEARRKYREQLVCQLRQSCGELSTRIQEAGASRDELNAALELLNREREQMPTADDWNQAIDLVREARQDVQRAEADVHDAQKREEEAHTALASVEREIRERSRGLPYGQTMEDWEEAKDAAEDYQAALSGAEAGLNSLRAARESEETSAGTLEILLENREDKEQSLRENQRDWNREQAQAETIQEELDRPENREREQRIQALNQSIEEWRKKLNAASNELSRLEERQKNLGERISQAESALEQAARKEQLCGRYFSEDLNLGFSGFRSEDGLEVCARSAAGAVPASAQGRVPEDMNDALRRNFMEHNNSLLKYHPENRLMFDPPEDTALPRQRLCVTLRMEGKTLTLYEFAEALQGKIDEVKEVWAKQDRKLFETILMDTLSKKLRARIDSSRDWVQRMTKRMSSLRTSMDLTFSLEWKERAAENETELGTAELVKLLGRDAKLLTPEDSNRLTEHFLSLIKRLREEAVLREELPNYTDLIYEALDYRNWYQFHIFYRRGGEQKKELTDRVFNRFSGGEKAMSMYIPLFASVSAHYQKAREDAPLLLALDEAFAGVDEKNIAAMFGLLHTLDFDYIMNSQVLWGCYSCVESLDIAELRRPDNAAVVTVMRCHWNGRSRETEENL